MAGDTSITLIGNLVADPELRFTPNGKAVANFRVASTPKKFNKQTQQFEDGQGLFLTVNVWNQQAENVAESLQRGMRVVVEGHLQQRSFETREGEKRTVYELLANEVAPSLRYATAKMTRNPREDSGNQGGQLQGQQSQSDPWGQPANSQPQGGGFGGVDSGEAPF